MNEDKDRTDPLDKIMPLLDRMEQLLAEVRAQAQQMTGKDNR